MVGGIGDLLIKASWADRAKYYNKWIFELSYFIVLVVIFLNMFLAVIASTFAQLRDEKRMIKDDIENRCFICNIDRQTFDKDGDGSRDTSSETTTCGTTSVTRYT